jgi:carboxyl-terminal processing protease
MSPALLTPFRAALCFLAFLVTSNVSADGPAKRDQNAERAEFIEAVAAVIEVIHESYCLPLENGRLLRWAVEGIYSRRGQDVPDEVAERLEGALNLDKKELRAVLARVADDCTNDYRRCADLAFGQMLRQLDSACEIWEQRAWVLPGQPIFLRQSIGVHLGKDQASGMPRVLFPFRNGPAYKAGLRTGDAIVEIRRPEAPPIEARTIPTRGLTLAAVYQAIEERQGSVVHLKVARPGVRRLLTLDVVRGKAPEETVLGVRRDAADNWEYWLDAGRKIAYVRISGFRPVFSEDFARVLGDLRKQGMNGLILDLRGNPGGLLGPMVWATELLVGEAPICSLANREGWLDQFAGERGKKPLGCPVACLVNRDTGRVAEVMAAALQDNKRAVIVGERTQGNAAIQLISPTQHHQVKLTSTLYYRPSGKKLARICPPGKPSEEWGVSPDKGFDLSLPDPEQDRLRAFLDEQFAIYPAGRVDAEPLPAWTDRQRELAVTYLRESIGKT